MPARYDNRSFSAIKIHNLLKGPGLIMLFATLVPPAAPAENQADARLGRTLFLQHCAACHGPDARGNAAVAAALHTTIPDYRSERVQNLRDGDIRTVVKDGWGKMPPVPNLSSQDVQNLIAYIRTFAVGQRKQAGEEGFLLRGEELFSGRIRFKNGGPACYTCHNIRGLPFPGGGTMGPDLTRVYSRLGPQGLETALETKYFPTMAPLYHPHPLTVTERADMKAFLEAADVEPPSPDITPVVCAIAVAGFAILVAMTWFLWRDRLRGVRRKLVENARSAR
jgi:mono/diheme cytochrome c family protein